MELSLIKPETSISSSRITQESVKVAQGDNAYANLALFISSNIEQIDRLAEFTGQVASRLAVKQTYDRQYFDPKQPKKSFMTRNIYLSNVKKEKFENERFIVGAAVNAATEIGIKVGARLFSNWASKKDTYMTCKQMYCFLRSYIENSEKGADRVSANIELNKIRNSLPLSIKEKRQLIAESNAASKNLSDLEISSLLSDGNNEVRNALAYFLAAIHRQLYKDQNPSKNLMPAFYSLLGIDGAYGRELQNDNLNNYDSIAEEQVRYLQLSRGIVKNLFVDRPEVNMEQILQRSKEMAKYDPYSIRRKMVQKASGGAALTIGGIITQNPELAFNGLSTALSQFLPSDETLSLAKERMRDWGIGGNQFDMIVNTSKSIETISQNSDIGL